MDNQEKTNKKKELILFIVLGIILFFIVAGTITISVITNKQEECSEDSGVHTPSGYKKPIIYLYPTEETEISVKLGHPEMLTCSYPLYQDGWNVVAKPDGSLVDLKTGRKLYSLYWEGIDDTKLSFEEGFVVKGLDTAYFLEEKLEILGLNEFEAEEFILYWLPELQKNEYNFIHFASLEEINEIMSLEFSKKPDTLIRVLMEFKKLDSYIEVKEQQLETPTRQGFTVVEWGGVEVK